MDKRIKSKPPMISQMNNDTRVLVIKKTIILAVLLTLILSSYILVLVFLNLGRSKVIDLTKKESYHMEMNAVDNSIWPKEIQNGRLLYEIAKDRMVLDVDLNGDRRGMLLEKDKMFPVYFSEDYDIKIKGIEDEDSLSMYLYFWGK